MSDSSFAKWAEAKIPRATPVADSDAVVALVATQSNITLSGLQTIDGVGVPAEAIVLVTHQTNVSFNAVYRAKTGAWKKLAKQPLIVHVLQGTSGRLAWYWNGATGLWGANYGVYG